MGIRTKIILINLLLLLFFSCNENSNVNKELGPEMKSTGEAIYFIDDLMDDYFMKIYSERNLYLSR